jgi:hypothetical protein
VATRFDRTFKEAAMGKWIMLWVASLLVVGLASAFAAQGLTQGQLPEPRIISGSDIGFRLESIDPYSGRPAGRLVVQVDGEWIEVAFSPATRRLH